MTTKVSLYDRDGSYLKDLLSLWSPRVNINRDNACRRTAEFACAEEYLNDLKVMGRQIKIFDSYGGVKSATAPTFSRSSTAYNPDTGELVEANVPRFVDGPWAGSKAMLVEGGTTNILSASASQGLSWAGYLGCVLTVTPNQPDPFNGNKGVHLLSSGGTDVLKALILVGMPANKVRWAGQLWMRNRSSVEITVHTNLGGVAAVVSPHSEWTPVRWVLTGDGRSKAEIRLMLPTAEDILDCDVAFLQCEAKPYHTTWHLGGAIRSNESLTIPTPVVCTPDNFHLEFFAYIDSMARWKAVPLATLFHFPRSVVYVSNTGIWMYHSHTSAEWVLLTRKDDNASQATKCSDAYTPDGWHYFVVDMTPARASVRIDGIERIVRDNPYLPSGFAANGYLGSYHVGNSVFNGKLCCWRFSSRARTDEEILQAYQSNAPLPVDEWTIYRLVLGESTLSAECWGITEEQVFDGSVDSVRRIKTSKSKEVQVLCRDKAKKLLLAGFDEDTTYEDLTASDTKRVISSISATSNIAVNDQIEKYASLYKCNLYATVLGVEKLVTPQTESGHILTNNYVVTYSETGLTQLRLEVEVDLRVIESVKNISIGGTGTAEDIETSQDGLTWAAYADITSWRYVRWSQVIANTSLSSGLRVYTNAAYPIANITTDGVDSWRPAATDHDRKVTIDLGSSQTCNVLYLRWGISSLDRSTVFTYLVERSTDGISWTTVGTYIENASYLAEHLFAAVPLRYLRITVLSAMGGLFALRYADVRYTVSTVSIDTVIQDIAESEGETSFSFTATRRYVAGGAVTFEAGMKKFEAMKNLAESIGFEIFYSRTGVLTLKPRDKYDLSDVPEFDDPLWIDAEWSDDEVYNQVIAVYESSTVSLRSIAQDGDGASPTGIPNVGTRTAPIIRSPFADTQEKLDALALVELQKASRPRIPVSFEDLADSTLESGDVIRITDDDISGLFVVESFTLLSEADREIMTCEVIPL